jgi:hypothetical protein
MMAGDDEIGAGSPMGHLSERQLARKYGISRAKMWRAKMVSSIPEAEFEAMVESDTPPTVSALVDIARGKAKRTFDGLHALKKAWKASTEVDRVNFLNWVIDDEGTRQNIG